MRTDARVVPDLSTVMERREYHCKKCRVHGIEVPLKGHKGKCPWDKCGCDGCLQVVSYRRQHVHDGRAMTASDVINIANLSRKAGRPATESTTAQTTRRQEARGVRNTAMYRALNKSMEELAHHTPTVHPIHHIKKAVLDFTEQQSRSKGKATPHNKHDKYSYLPTAIYQSYPVKSGSCRREAEAYPRPGSSHQSEAYPRPGSSHQSEAYPRPGSSHQSEAYPRPGSSHQSEAYPRPGSSHQSEAYPRPGSSYQSEAYPRPGSSHQSEAYPRPGSSYQSEAYPRPGSSHQSEAYPRPGSSHQSEAYPRPGSSHQSEAYPRPGSSRQADVDDDVRTLTEMFPGAQENLGLSLLYEIRGNADNMEQAVGNLIAIMSGPTTPSPKRNCPPRLTRLSNIFPEVGKGILKAVSQQADNTPSAVETILRLCYSPDTRPAASSIGPTPVCAGPRGKRKAQRLDFGSSSEVQYTPGCRTPRARAPSGRVVNFNRDVESALQAAEEAENTSGGGTYTITPTRTPTVPAEDRRTPVKKRVIACKQCGTSCDRLAKFCHECGGQLSNRSHRY
ncbi:uncharacterized protein LOC118415549 [Branchiostoma floridae]|uniref:Uncharacterized protein LOC118415549 n=1 Tax=Branchiostoma floridae TaxID=7739 RepID=A0A9J7L601_BRAFL|nr:uncharacterized protein LOC118415549 [Branchiostoma floridae]